MDKRRSVMKKRNVYAYVHNAREAIKIFGGSQKGSTLGPLFSRSQRAYDLLKNIAQGGEQGLSVLREGAGPITGRGPAYP